MGDAVETISLFNLAIAFVPVFFVLTILFKWSMDVKHFLYAVFRMLLQLMVIGYFLTYIFAAESALIVLVILIIMLFCSSWIALGNVKYRRFALYRYALFSILIGGGSVLILITQLVLHLEPWYLPRYMIPLAGMIFANSMNSVSLASERLNAELHRDLPYEKARKIALSASLIPIVNSLFAVGLVSIPGMMTGQILSGISPLIAARYQIMVMCMIFSAAGISSVCFLLFVKTRFSTTEVK